MKVPLLTAARLAPLLLLVALASCRPMSCRSSPPAEFLRLMPLIGSAPGFTADATEDVRTRRGDRLITSSRWSFRKPGQLRIETPQAGDGAPSRLLVADGQKIWMRIGDYYFTSANLLPAPLWILNGLSPDSLRNFNRIAYEGTSEVGGVEAAAFEFSLAEVVPSAPMKRIHIAFGTADGIPRKIVGRNESGEVEAEVALANVRIDALLPDGLFVFTVPPGTKVEELR